jgi:hypothetical protein
MSNGVSFRAMGESLFIQQNIAEHSGDKGMFDLAACLASLAL